MNKQHINQKLWLRMNDANTKFSKSDKKIIHFIREQPEQIMNMPIAKLANLNGLSEPTINRFCHKLGCNGYPDFKLQLVQSLAASPKLYTESVNANDSILVVVSKILKAIQESCDSLENTLDPEIIEGAAHLFTNCKSVNFFGVGACGPVALDAQHKFFRLGMPVIAHTDYVNQKMICSLLGDNDIAVFISYSGRTKEIVDNAKIAYQNGVKTIGITKDNTPLSSYCHYVLNAVTTEDTDVFTPMTSRIIHLAMIDILAITVAMQLEATGKQISKDIAVVKQNVQLTRYPANDNH